MAKHQTTPYSTDTQLPHPIRCRIVSGDVFDRLAEAMPEEWPDIQQVLQNPALVVSEAMHELSNRKRFPRMSQFLNMTLHAPGSSAQGGATGLITWARHELRKDPTFRIDDELLELLIDTDIASDVDVSVLTLPFPRLYLEFGTKRSAPFYVFNNLTGEHPLEGVYLETGATSTGQPVLCALFTGGPKSKENLLDDATQSTTIVIGQEGKSIADCIEDTYQSSAEDAKRRGLPPSDPDAAKRITDLMLLCCKALLYISMPETRRELHSDRAQALKAIEQIKATAKRNKALRNANKLQDCVIIRPQAAHLEIAEGIGDRTGKVSPHWRRRHMRMQHYGERNSLKKVIMIQTTLVGAKKGETPPVKNYTVK